ncbi:hypothetical protein [Longispora urticae]
MTMTDAPPARRVILGMVDTAAVTGPWKPLHRVGDLHLCREGGRPQKWWATTDQTYQLRTTLTGRVTVHTGSGANSYVGDLQDDTGSPPTALPLLRHGPLRLRILHTYLLAHQAGYWQLSHDELQHATASTP